MIFLVISHFQIYVISLAEPRLPLQLDDAIRPEVEGEEVKIILFETLCFLCMFSLQNIEKLMPCFYIKGTCCYKLHFYLSLFLTSAILKRFDL